MLWSILFIYKLHIKLARYVYYIYYYSFHKEPLLLTYVIQSLLNKH